MFLILSGHSEVNLEQLQKLPVSSEGVSLLALRDAARKYHVDVEIRSYRPEEINSLPLPAIGQFTTSKASITSGHFDVVYKVDRERVHLLNGTTGFEYSIRRSKLADVWNGFALVEKRSRATIMMYKWWPAILTACLLTVDVLIVAFWFHGLRKKSHETNNVISEVKVVA